MADIPTNKAGLTWRELLAKAALINACKGSGVIFKELFSRVEGKIGEQKEQQTDAVVRIKTPLKGPKKG